MKAITSHRRPVAQPDQSVTSCTSCFTPFSLSNRKHHCRACGYIFCAKCCSQRRPLAEMYYSGARRVCKDCFLKSDEELLYEIKHRLRLYYAETGDKEIENDPLFSDTNKPAKRESFNADMIIMEDLPDQKPDNSIETWDTDDVAEWLYTLRFDKEVLKEYQRQFKLNHIDGEVLLMLSSEDFQDKQLQFVQPHHAEIILMEVERRKKGLHRKK